MKKYFVKETDEVLEFGDTIGLCFEKEMEDGSITHEKEIEFTEGMVDFLLEMGIIEEKEVEEDSPKEFDDYPCDKLFDEIYDEIEDLEKRLEILEDNWKKEDKLLKKMYEHLQSLLELAKDNAKQQSKAKK